MALSNSELLFLDCLIYTDYVENGKTVGEIVAAIEDGIAAGDKINGGMMDSERWKELSAMIKNHPELLDYKVTNYINEETGTRAACFVDDLTNPKDVNIAFRGTSTDYEWHDNGEGGYLTNTKEQKAAADYVNSLPDEYGDYMTVTGHSKGGNKAQYVTITTDRIARCVSYDGQGFSNEFVDEYREKIEDRAGSITNISASNDYVNCLMIPIAGQRIYIETEKQDDFLNYHNPSILFDENGNLGMRTEQSVLSQAINEYTVYMLSALDEPERSIVIDGLLSFLEKGDDREPLIQRIYAGVDAASHIDDFFFNYVGETYGVPAERLSTLIGTLAFPYLFADDLIDGTIEDLEAVAGFMYDCAVAVGKKLVSIGEKGVEIGKSMISGVSTFLTNISTWQKKNFNQGYRYASENTYIKINTSAMRTYAERLSNVNKRIADLDRRMNSLYAKVGLRDLLSLLRADMMVGYNWHITGCAKYLNETAEDFDSTERTVSGEF